MDCKGPFVELINKRKAYEGQQEMVRGLLEGKLNEEKSKKQGKGSKEHQIKAEEVLERILEATKEEEHFSVAFGDKKSTLSLSKKTFINGLATSNKKLTVIFLKDSVIAKQIVLGQIIKPSILSNHINDLRSLQQSPAWQTFHNREIVAFWNAIRTVSLITQVLNIHALTLSFFSLTNYVRYFTGRFLYLLEIMIGGRDGKHASVRNTSLFLDFACLLDSRN